MPITSPQSPAGHYVVYDGECIFCSSYARLLRLSENIGKVVMVNARDREAVERLHLPDVDLDQGMAFMMDGQVYVGEEALQHIALLSTPSTVFNAMNYTVFRHRFLAQLFYPLLKLCRRSYLFIRGKKLINAARQ